MIKFFRDDHRFLSNFVPVPIVYGGLNFKSVEHAYVAAKTDNPIEQLHISTLETSGQAKRYGKTIELRPDFDATKLEIMEGLLRQKFLGNDHYGHLLHWTGNEKLVEGNTWHDNFWGSCVCERCGDSGQNNLGKLLMKIRDELKDKDKFDVIKGITAIESLEN